VTRGWWRRNAVALGVIAVLAPATAVAISFTAWRDLPTEHRIAVETGEAVPYGGAEIGPISARFDDVPGTPRASRVVAVRLEVDPEDEGFTCAVMLVESAAPHRRWGPSTTSLDRPYDPDRVTYCDSEHTSPYTVEHDFLVPDDAVGPFELELSGGAAREVLRLAVSP